MCREPPKEARSERNRGDRAESSMPGDVDAWTEFSKGTGTAEGRKRAADALTEGDQEGVVPGPVTARQDVL